MLNRSQLSFGNNYQQSLELKKIEGLDKQNLENAKSSDFMKKVQLQEQQIGTTFDSGIFSTQIITTKTKNKVSELSTFSDYDHFYKKNNKQVIIIFYFREKLI
jgi:hypothetical protein